MTTRICYMCNKVVRKVSNRNGIETCLRCEELTMKSLSGSNIEGYNWKIVLKPSRYHKVLLEEFPDMYKHLYAFLNSEDRGIYAGLKLALDDEHIILLVPEEMCVLATEALGPTTLAKFTNHILEEVNLFFKTDILLEEKYKL